MNNFKNTFEEEFINQNRTFVSWNGLQFKILFKLIHPTAYMYRIKFLETGYEKAASLWEIVNGYCFDNSTLKYDLLKIPVYKNKEGFYFRVIENKFEQERYMIQFLNTNTIIHADAKDIVEGFVKDYNESEIFGVFSLGMSYASAKQTNKLKQWSLFEAYLKQGEKFWQLIKDQKYKFLSFSNIYLDIEEDNFDSEKLFQKILSI